LIGKTFRMCWLSATRKGRERLQNSTDAVTAFTVIFIGARNGRGRRMDNGARKRESW
jgi:hypothetical protein